MAGLFDTWYKPVEPALLVQARRIRLLICDVDGVLSNGLLYWDSHGEALKSFHVHDGYGLCQLLAAKLELAIISGGTSQTVSKRATALNIRYVYQGQTDKTVAFQQLLQQLQLHASQVAYIGDDLIDWPVLKQVGLAVCVADAHPWLLSRVDYVTTRAGGQGAVRELCDLLLLSKGLLSTELLLSPAPSPAPSPGPTPGPTHSVPTLSGIGQ